MKDYQLYDYKQKLIMNPTCDLYLQAVLDPDKALGSHFRYFQKQTCGSILFVLVMDYSLLMEEISFQTVHRQIK